MQTVAHTLQWEGYTMKAVHLFFCLATVTHSPPNCCRSHSLLWSEMSRIARISRETSSFTTAPNNWSLLMRATSIGWPYAWAKRGDCASCYEFQFWGSKYSILPALSLNDILHLEVVENAVTGATFHRFVEGLLPCMNKWPLPNSVLVINNASIHKVAGICELVEEHGMHLMFLPSYSPNLNPIELSFSSIKAWLHANRDEVNREMESENGTVYNALWQVVYSVTPEKARGWYKHCGYQECA